MFQDVSNRKKHLPVVIYLSSGVPLKRLQQLFSKVTPFILQTKVNTLAFSRIVSDPFAILPNSISDPNLLKLTIPPEDGNHSPDCSFFTQLLNLSQAFIWHILTMRINSSNPIPDENQLRITWLKLQRLIDRRICGPAPKKLKTQQFLFNSQFLASKIKEVEDPVGLNADKKSYERYERNYITLLTRILTS
ncbi:MAG: hypothetical protein EZS28_009487 [Streblomastix strix]|uniref:Uncharacterized protein n=1 Tax=Streblomastix strix TaxID=222440 RepID=A0A5J4WJ18_9EUKA|nr:MAG: hypothetical protein EZS28_009487 [Streblomastix strix]